MNAMMKPDLAAMEQRTRRSIVVDDHPVVADALALAILSMRVFDRVECAKSLTEAFNLLTIDANCDLAILDLHLEETQGRETLTGLRERFPDVPVLVFTGISSLENITMAFECGARGFMSKTSPMNIVRNAISLVLAGGSYIPPEAVQILGFAAPPAAQGPSSPLPPVRFSARQEQVFQLLLKGMPNKVIASRLDMAEGTTKAHLNAVYRALGVRTRVEAILRARQLGLI
jgi:DNA-binding NarL/FixJ family response regulator